MYCGKCKYDEQFSNRIGEIPRLREIILNGSFIIKNIVINAFSYSIFGAKK